MKKLLSLLAGLLFAFNTSAGATVYVDGVKQDVGATGTFTTTLTLENSETIANSTDDMIEFDGVGGTDNTDLRIDLDGTHPVIDSPTDSKIEVAETLQLGSATGNTLAAATGVLTIAGVGNTNNENITIDLETTSNWAIFGSGTGLTNWKIPQSIRLDDGVTTSPSLVFVDGTTWATTIAKGDASDLVVTLAEADDFFRVDTGGIKANGGKIELVGLVGNSPNLQSTDATGEATFFFKTNGGDFILDFSGGGTGDSFSFKPETSQLVMLRLSLH